MYLYAEPYEKISPAIQEKSLEEKQKQDCFFPEGKYMKNTFRNIVGIGPLPRK